MFKSFLGGLLTLTQQVVLSVMLGIGYTFLYWLAFSLAVAWNDLSGGSRVTLFVAALYSVFCALWVMMEEEGRRWASILCFLVFGAGTTHGLFHLGLATPWSGAGFVLAYLSIFVGVTAIVSLWQSFHEVSVQKDP